MSAIELHFTKAKHPELHRVFLEHDLLDQSILSVRGKSSGAFQASSSFQWTSGVKALALLIVRTKLQLSDYSPDATLYGDYGSAAMALDSSLGKMPCWIEEMFGSDAQNRPCARRLFRRSNPNRKLKGPVGVALNLRYWHPLQIKLYVDGAQLEDLPMLKSLADEIEQSFKQRVSLVQPEGQCHFPKIEDRRQSISLSEPYWRDRLKKVMCDEVLLGLQATEIFNRRNLKQTVQSISRNESFRHVAGANQAIVSDMDLSLTPSDRLGVIEHESEFRRLLCPDEPFLINCPSPIPGSLVLFLYLRDVKGYNLELDFSNAHTVETARKSVKREFFRQPDFSVLAIAPAATVLAQGQHCEYLPIMMLPRLSQGILGPKGAKDAPVPHSREFIFVGDDPSISSFLYEELVRCSYIDGKKSKTRHVENDEALQYLDEADLNARAILFFPFYHINHWVNGCEPLADPRPTADLQETILFGHQRVTHNKQLVRCLDIAIRDAWLELKASPELMARTVDRLLDEPNYLKVLGRHAGLYTNPTPLGIRGESISGVTTQ